MKILAYDTSSEVLTAAIFDGQKKVAELESGSFARHSSVLVPVLDKLLRSSRIDLSQIEVIAVGLGPGSFTGLRVGVTTAKILAYTRQIKLIGVSSLESIALQGKGFEGDIAVILDAKKEMLYAGLYEISEGRFKIIQDPKLVTINSLVKNLKKPRLFLGDGVKIHHDKISASDRCRIIEKADSVYPRASCIVQRATDLVQKKRWADPFKLEPLYLHPRDCNVNKK